MTMQPAAINVSTSLVQSSWTISVIRAAPEPIRMSAAAPSRSHGSVPVYGFLRLPTTEAMRLGGDTALTRRLQIPNCQHPHLPSGQNDAPILLRHRAFRK